MKPLRQPTDELLVNFDSSPQEIPVITFIDLFATFVTDWEVFHQYEPSEIYKRQKRILKHNNNLLLMENPFTL